MNFTHYTTKIKLIFNQVGNDKIEELVRLLKDIKKYGETVFIIGNGGNAANSSHMCEDLIKGPLNEASMPHRKRLRVFSLTDNIPAIAAWGNDEGYSNIFVEQLRTFAKMADVLIAISVSGNSLNVIRAVQYAHSIGMTTVGLTGCDGGTLGKKSDLHINIPSDNFGIVEVVHDAIWHYVVEKLK